LLYPHNTFRNNIVYVEGREKARGGGGVIFMFGWKGRRRMDLGEWKDGKVGEGWIKVTW